MSCVLFETVFMYELGLYFRLSYSVVLVRCYSDFWIVNLVLFLFLPLILPLKELGFLGLSGRRVGEIEDVVLFGTVKNFVLV